jgi:hypothetical protein
MKLSPEQVMAVRKLVDEGGITFDLLREDVIDHICCVVEVELDRRKNFEAAVQEAMHELAPDGLQEIQRETVFLLNSTKIIRMKKVMYSVGLISSICVSIGFLMKLLHLPGGNQVLTYGLLTFGLLFLPMIAINHFKMSIKRALSDKLRTILGLVSGIMISLGVIFKMLHIILADELLISGIVIFSFGFLPFLFFTMYRKSVS